MTLPAGTRIRKILTIAVASAAILAALSWFGCFLATPNGEKGTALVVNAGESGDTIAQHLKDAGVVRSLWLFKLALRRSGLADELKPGVYDFRGAATYDEVVKILTTGGVNEREVVLRVIEGWNLNDIRARLQNMGLAAADGFFAVTGEPARVYRTGEKAPPDLAAVFPFLKGKPTNIGLEGYLFPDTYRLFKDASAADIVRIMLANFRRRLTADDETKIKAAGRTLHQVVTLASIVEKEVRTDVDRRLVADIFWRRLDAGWPLQADSTVNYVTHKGLAAVSLADMEIDSPYNTYKHSGLPPGPIGNPGRAAIDAAIAPTPNDYWYFLTDADGRTYYARTYEEHVRNKEKYLK